MNGAELVHARPTETPFDILRAGFAELRVTDLAASEHFYVDVLGLQVTERADDAIFLRGWEERAHHSIVLRAHSLAAAARLALRVRRETDLEPLAQAINALGGETRFVDRGERAIGRALEAYDPFGYPLLFYHAAEQLGTTLQRFDLQRGAPIMRIDHFNLHCPEVERALVFWHGLGFRCTEYIATDPEGPSERITGAWLTRKPTVHDIALTAGRGPRLHHLGLYVDEPGGVTRTCDQIAAAGLAASIERGPGRHGVSNAFFVYLRDPDGHRIELYACDYYTGDPDHAPIRWSVADPRCRTFWGTRAPNSWYEESSLVLGADSAPVALYDATVEERDSHTEVMA